MEMARSIALALAVVLIERVPSIAARWSAPTRSTPGRPCRNARRVAPDDATSASEVVTIDTLTASPTGVPTSKPDPRPALGMRIRAGRCGDKASIRCGGTGLRTNLEGVEKRPFQGADMMSPEIEFQLMKSHASELRA